MDITEEVTPTLRAGMGGHPPLVSQPNCLNGWDTQQSRVFTPEGVAPTLAGADGGGGRNPAGLLFAAGVISKGDGDYFLTPEVHTSITSGAQRPEESVISQNVRPLLKPVLLHRCFA